MPRNPELRRSRSWKDLSSFMSKKLFTSEQAVPELPLHRSSSLGRRQWRKEDRKSRMFHDFDELQPEQSVPTVEERRRTLQKRPSTKRKAPPTKNSSPTVKHQTRASQIHGFAFSPKVDGPRPAPARHSRSHSRNISASTGHSRKISEMSVPLVLDFDLAYPQNSSTALSINGFDFGFTLPPLIDRDLTPEEKANLISSVAPMHIIQIPSQKPTKQNSLKRLFSLRKGDKGSPASSKRNSPQELSPPPARSIYTRPPAVGRRTPPSPPPSPGSAPPRLTVQIPDSTFDRASKLFQSIYAAHASAQESYTSKEQWGIPTPVSASPPLARTAIHGEEIKYIKNVPEDVSSSFNAEGRTVPKALNGKWSLKRNVEMKRKSDRLWEDNEFRSQSNESPSPAPTTTPAPQLKEVRPVTNNATPRNTTPPLTTTQIPVQVPMASTRGRITAFPVQITKVVPIMIYESTDEYESSEEEDFKDSDDEGDDETTTEAFKEPAWEMLTPTNRLRRKGQ